MCGIKLIFLKYQFLNKFTVFSWMRLYVFQFWLSLQAFRLRPCPQRCDHRCWLCCRLVGCRGDLARFKEGFSRGQTSVLRECGCIITCWFNWSFFLLVAMSLYNKCINYIIFYLFITIWHTVSQIGVMTQQPIDLLNYCLWSSKL